MTPLIDRIRLDETTGCWNWIGGTYGGGYGKTKWNGKYISAHRLAAFIWLRMPLNDPREVCHSCDNPRCFNPKHLFLGTHKENMQDSFKKGRSRVPAPRTPRAACPKGHLYDLQNTYLRERKDKPPLKICRTCDRERWANRKSKPQFGTSRQKETA